MARTSSPRSTTSRSSSLAGATASCARSSTSVATAGRLSSRRRAGRRSASSAHTTAGSTTSRAISSGPSTPRTSTTSTRKTWSCRRPDGDVARLRVRVPLPRDAATGRLARRPAAPLRPSTSDDCGRPMRSPTRSRRTGSSSPRTTASATTAGIHPQLNKLTPYDLGGDFAPTGPRRGGWMELVESAETMALEGSHRNGRPPLLGITPVDERRIYYYLIRPMTFLSSTRTTCCPSAEPAGPATPGRLPVAVRAIDDRLTDFDPSDAIAFWDLTNRQDWHVCELQQRGTRSRSWSAGRYSNQEPSVHAFDLMAVDRYANDGVNSQRTVRLRYDVPTPRTTTTCSKATSRRSVAAVGAGDRDALGRPDEGRTTRPRPPVGARARSRAGGFLLDDRLARSGSMPRPARRSGWRWP